METEHIEKKKDAISAFIEDAIAGGWKKSGYLKTRNITVKKGGFTLKYANEEWDGTEKWAEFLKVEEALLDPNAWRAVGKTRGWKSEGGSYHDEIAWQEYWHRFIDHLADGDTLDTALGKL